MKSSLVATTDQRALVDQFPGMMLVLEPEKQQVRFAGGELLRILGEWFDHRPLVNISQLRERIEECDRDASVMRIEEGIAQRSGWDIEYRIAGHPTVKWLREKGVFGLSGSGASQVNVYILDVTPFKTREEGLAEDLVRARRRVAAKDRYFASTSHELRTPLNGVLGMAQVLARTSLSRDQREYVNIIMESTKALLTVVNDVLDLAKIEAGKLELVDREIDLAHVCGGVFDLLASRAWEKDVDLVLDLPPEVPTLVRADGDRLRQVLLNLVGNAVKFSEGGWVKLTVGVAEGRGGEHPWFRFQVDDNGVGIDQSAQEKLFNAFAQADGSVATRFGGTGLGLLISKQLVELMDGEIGFSSEAGVGSSFYFEVPFEVLGPVQSPVELPHCHVLLVTPSPLQNQVYKRVFEEAGAVVTVCCDSEEAIAVLSGVQRYHVAVVDLAMPIISGLRLAQLICTSEFHCETRTLLFASVTDHVDRAELSQAGVDAFFRKPLAGGKLLDAVARLLVGEPAEEGQEAGSAGTAAGFDRPRSVRFHGRVLVAEDVDVNQQVLNIMLAGHGVVADFVSDGRQAVQRAGEQEYDLIFMDCQMPVMDGLEATRRIRERFPDPQALPIVALTAGGQMGEREQCQAAGMNGFLSKPVIEDELVRTLAQFLDYERVDHMAVTPVEDPADVQEGIDWGVFDKICSMFEHRMEDYLTSLYQRCEEQVRAMQQELAAGNFGKVVERAHAVKGVIGIIGAERARDIAAEIEQSASGGDVVDLSLKINALGWAVSQAKTATFKRVNEALEQQVVLF